MRKRGAFHLFLLNEVLYHIEESESEPRVLAPVYLQELLIHGLLTPTKKHPAKRRTLGEVSYQHRALFERLNRVKDTGYLNPIAEDIPFHRDTLTGPVTEVEQFEMTDKVLKGLEWTLPESLNVLIALVLLNGAPVTEEYITQRAKGPEGNLDFDFRWFSAMFLTQCPYGREPRYCLSQVGMDFGWMVYDYVLDHYEHVPNAHYWRAKLLDTELGSPFTLNPNPAPGFQYKHSFIILSLLGDFMDVSRITKSDLVRILQLPGGERSVENALSELTSEGFAEYDEETRTYALTHLGAVMYGLYATRIMEI